MKLFAKVSLSLFIFFAFAGTALAQQDLSLPAFTLSTNPDGSQEYSVTLQILIFMTALSFIPAAVIMMTSFTRIVVIMAILRQAFGLQQTPSNQVIIGLTLFMTLFIMTPVYNKVDEVAIQPYLAEQLTSVEAIDKGKEPLREFMLAQTRLKDLNTLAEMADIDYNGEPETLPMTVIIPAFIISELKTAFQIAFLLFIPFLVIDLIISNVLLSLGMFMLSPAMISLPFKILLFVLTDGWFLLTQGLLLSFQ